MQTGISQVLSTSSAFTDYIVELSQSHQNLVYHFILQETAANKGM